MILLVKFLCIHYSLMIIADKYKLSENLQKGSNKLSGSKWVLIRLSGLFFYKVAECRFCLTHHVGALILPILIILIGFDWGYLLYPLISTGGIFLIKSKH